MKLPANISRPGDRASSKAMSLAVSLIPPLFMSALRAARNRTGNGSKQEWEYISDNEVSADGWNVEAVARAQSEKWASFREAIEGTKPLGIAHEAAPPYKQNPTAHNLVMSFGYVLGRTLQGRVGISVLDWGGGLGHYYLLAKALYPGASLEYACKEVPVLARKGRSLLHEVTFIEEDGEALGRSYDLVLASGSLHYEPSWQDLLGNLARASRTYLYVTRLPIVSGVPSFRILQRAHRYGYGTEYIGWALNRSEFLDVAERAGVTLVREFLVNERPRIPNAPEACDYGGFLFRRS